jgi:hypothetical protein
MIQRVQGMCKLLLRLRVLLPQMENLALKHSALLHDEFI